MYGDAVQQPQRAVGLERVEGAASRENAPTARAGRSSPAAMLLLGSRDALQVLLSERLASGALKFAAHAGPGSPAAQRADDLPAQALSLRARVPRAAAPHDASGGRTPAASAAPRSAHRDSHRPPRLRRPTARNSARDRSSATPTRPPSNGNALGCGLGVRRGGEPCGAAPEQVRTGSPTGRSSDPIRSPDPSRRNSSSHRSR